MPPSAEAESILSSMTEDERLNFDELLRLVQQGYDSGPKGPAKFHPETRAAYWGVALSKLAHHYFEVGNDLRAIFFTLTAWDVSKHPVFAYNAGIFLIESDVAGDVAIGREVLKIYLAEYGKVLKNSIFMAVYPSFTAEDLESMAQTARSMLIASGEAELPRRLRRVTQ